MKARWIGVALVVIAAAGTIAYRHRRSHNAAEVARTTPVTPVPKTAAEVGPEVILVANLREADEPGDNCAEIIHLVRDAGSRGIKTQELSPDSTSPLIKRYHVLTAPTVLILDGGKVVSRYEGESGSTVSEIRGRLATLNEAGR